MTSKSCTVLAFDWEVARGSLVHDIFQQNQLFAESWFAYIVLNICLKYSVQVKCIHTEAENI